MIRKKRTSRLHKIPRFVAWIFPRRIWFGEKGNVYLTFDDGPHPEITPWLLEFLKTKNIKATFFWSGCNLINQKVLLEQALKEGHAVGHHGFKHVSGKKTSFNEYVSNFDQSNKLVNSNLFRPPYGDLTLKQANYILRQNRIVMWSWLSYDFDHQMSISKILKRGKKQIKSGDIIVFHENNKTKERLKEIIPGIIQDIRDKGLNFAKLQ